MSAELDKSNLDIVTDVYTICTRSRPEYRAYEGAVYVRRAGTTRDFQSPVLPGACRGRAPSGPLIGTRNGPTVARGYDRPRINAH